MGWGLWGLRTDLGPALLATSHLGVMGVFVCSPGGWNPHLSGGWSLSPGAQANGGRQTSR